MTQVSSKDKKENVDCWICTYNNRMNSSDSSTGEHCDRQLHDHWHVDRDTIALVDAVHFENIGEAANLFQQLSVRELAVVVLMVSFPFEIKLRLSNLICKETRYVNLLRANAWLHLTKRFFRWAARRHLAIKEPLIVIFCCCRTLKLRLSFSEAPLEVNRDGRICRIHNWNESKTFSLKPKQKALVHRVYTNRV